MGSVHVFPASRGRLVALGRHSVRMSALDMELVKLVAASVTHHGQVRAVPFTAQQDAKTTALMLAFATMASAFVSLG